MKSNIYTRTGDEGTTSLVGGERASKDCSRIEAYGDIDELSSALGLLAADARCVEEIRDQIGMLQNVMFEVGAYLATPVKEGEEKKLEGMEDDTRRLEGWIDSLDERLPALTSFVLPGGSEAAARCHLARTICRRAERHIIALQRNSFVDPRVVAFVNRLSDYLFVAARYLNFIAGVDEIAWHPRK